MRYTFKVNGVATDADATTNVTATIRNSADEVVLNAAVATKVETGKYEIVVPPAQTAIMDIYEISWSIRQSNNWNTYRSRYEVVGDFITSLSDIRSVAPELAEVTDYDDEMVARAREAAEEYMEKACGISFRPRGRRVWLGGRGDGVLMLPDLYVTKVVSVKVGTTAFTTSEIEDLVAHSFGILERPGGLTFVAGSRNVEVLYEYGLLEAPEPVRRATAQLAAAKYLVKSGLPDRAESITTSEGTIRMSMAGPGKTGIQEVDAVIADFTHDVPAIA